MFSRHPPPHDFPTWTFRPTLDTVNLLHVLIINKHYDSLNVLQIDPEPIKVVETSDGDDEKEETSTSVTVKEEEAAEEYVTLTPRHYWRIFLHSQQLAQVPHE